MTAVVQEVAGSAAVQPRRVVARTKGRRNGPAVRVVDTNNPLQKQPLPPIDIGGRASTAVVAEMVPGARVVKAFNHHASWNLAAEPAKEGGQRMLFYAGDDAWDKARRSQP